MNSALNSYKQTQVETVGQGEIVVLLYDGAIRFLNQAKERIEKKDFAGKGTAISRALDIIAELDSSLNMEKGGEVAVNLHSLYLFASTTLLKANMKLDIGMIDHVIHMLSELKYSFEIIIQSPEAKAVAEQIRASRSNSTFVARNVTEAPSAGVGKNAAASAYKSVARSAGVEPIQTPQSSTPDQMKGTAPKEVDQASVANFLAQSAPQGAQQAPAQQTPVFATIEPPKGVQMQEQAQEGVGGFDLQASLYNLRQNSAQKVLNNLPENNVAAPTPPPASGLKTSLSSTLNN